MDHVSRNLPHGNAGWIAPLLGFSTLLSVIVLANWIAIPIVGVESALSGTAGAMLLATLFAIAVTRGEHH